MLTTPGVTTAGDHHEPLPVTLMISAWSSRTRGSGCQRPPSHACCGGKPGSYPVVRGTSPVISTDRLGQETGLPLLDHLEAGLGQGRRLVAGVPVARSGQLNPAATPEMRMNKHRHIHLAQRPNQPVDPGRVIEVAVAAHDGLDRARVDVERRMFSVTASGLVPAWNGNGARARPWSP